MTRARAGAGALAELGVFVGWALLLIWPVSAHLATRTVGSGDARHWLWVGWRIARLVGDGKVPTRIPDILWPYGANLLVADGALPSAVAGFWNLLVSPVLAFNLAVVSALVMNGLAARYLASIFTQRRVVMILAGLAFAGAPALTIRLEGHYNLLFAFPAPLLLALALRVARGEMRVPPIRMGLLLALAYVSSGYYFFFGAITVAVVLVLGSSPWKDRGRDVLRFALAGLVALVVLAPFLVPKFQLERRERAAGARTLSSGAESFSADVLSAVVPPFGGRLSISALDDLHVRLGGNTLELTSFPGVLGLAGIAGAAVLATRVRRPLLGAAFALWLLSLGPTPHILGEAPLEKVAWLPMAGLLQLPGMAGVRAPNRASFTLAAVAAACFALTLAWGFERLRPAGRVAVVVAAATLLVAGARTPVGWSQEQLGAPVERALEKINRTAAEDDAFIHLPTDCLGNAFEITLQIEHRRPVVGCQGFDAAIPWETGLPAYFDSLAWANLRCSPPTIGSRAVDLPAGFDGKPSPDAVQALPQELPVRFVIFNRVNECPERGQEVLAALQQGANQIADDGQYIVFDLEPDR